MDRPKLRSRSRELMRSSSPRPAYVGAVYVIILAVFAYLSYKLVGRYMADFIQQQMQNMPVPDLKDPLKYNMELNRYYASLDPERLMFDMQRAMPPTSASLLNLLLTVMKWIVGAGFIIFSLRTVSGETPAFANLLDGFGTFLRIVCLYLLELVFISMWTMLFIVPGVFAFYRYRMAIYLLLEHPDMSPFRCILESSRMMSGHKGQLFALDMSFIGWLALSYVITVIGSLTGLELLNIVGLGYIVYIWLLPYAHLSWAQFYKELSKSCRPAPDSMMQF